MNKITRGPDLRLARVDKPELVMFLEGRIDDRRAGMRRRYGNVPQWFCTNSMSSEACIPLPVVSVPTYRNLTDRPMNIGAP